MSEKKDGSAQFLRNNTNYPAQVRTELAKIPKSLPDTDAESFLRYYQRVTLNAFLKFDMRGMLMYVTMGFGKSVMAAAIAAAFFGKYRILFLSSRSIHDNFRGNVAKYLRGVKHMSSQQASDTIDRNFTFVTLNAGNVLQTLEQLNEDRLKSLLSHMQTLDHTMVIVDEAHNLFNAIVNGSKNASIIYNKIMEAKNIRVLFLTGTPMINDPFELVPCFNMIDGSKLLPEYWNVFHDMFVKNGRIHNVELFKDRVFGLTSYYGDFYQTDSKDGVIRREGFPDEMPTQMHKIKMSDTQLGLHTTVRERERIENREAQERAGNQAPKNMSIPKSAGFSTYRVRSRKACLFAYPEGTYENIDGKIVRKEVPEKYLTGDALANVSPKYKFLIDFMKKTGEWPIIIYSNFVSDEGLDMFARILDFNKYQRWTTADTAIDPDLRVTLGGIEKRRYAMVTGKQTPEERTVIMKEYNDKRNVDGALISVILLSPAGAEGLSFRHTMDIFIVDPYWNMNRLDQVKFRAIRFHSHDDKPKNKQRVRVHALLAVYPNNEDQDEPTTDVAIYNMALAKGRLISQFRAALVESSIDCTTHHEDLPASIKKRIKCKLCTPNGQKLYDPHRIMTKSNCVPYTERNVKTKKIKYGDNIYHYDSEKNIYMFSDDINAWVLMPRHHPDYAGLSEKLT